MSHEKKEIKNEDASIQKQNEDFPNIPVSSEKIDSEKTFKKEVHHTSELHKDGKTDNTEKNSEN